MGNCMHKKGGGQKLTIAILGLDNAGKTVTAKGLKGECLDSVVPTAGFSSVEFTFENFDITMFDLGGGKKIRDIWRNYFGEIYGLIYVIDSSESARIDECRGVLEMLLKDDKISGKPILVLANKQDKPGALDEYDICEHLELEELVNTHKTPCRVELCSAIIGQGKKLDKSIKMGMKWLLCTIRKNFEILNERIQKDVARQKEREAEERKEKLERVRKIREEREKQEREERRRRGEPESAEEDNDEPLNGDPFKKLDKAALEKKELQLKEEKKIKEALENSKTSEDDMNPLNRTKRSPLKDSPRPSHRLSYGQSGSRSPSPTGEGKDVAPYSAVPSLSASRLPPLISSTKAPNRGVLAPIGTLEPLETLEPASLERRTKKKKKKARKNQTTPGEKVGESGDGGEGYDESDVRGTRGWPAPTRASRSPRLDTVSEPENEHSFRQKWGLVDELPELPEEDEYLGSSKPRRPNSDFQNIVT